MDTFGLLSATIEKDMQAKKPFVIVSQWNAVESSQNGRI